MKITFLLTQDLESPSGLGRYLPLARQLAQLGYKPRIFAMHSDYQSVANKVFKVDGVQVKYISQMHVLKRGNHKSYFNPIRLLWTVLVGTWKLTLAALMTPTDVYHIGKPHPMNGLAGLIAAKLKRKPVYLDCDDYEAGSGRFQGNWQRWIITLFEKWMPKRVKSVTTNTTFMQENLIRWGVPPHRIVYLPNGVDRDRFSLPDPIKIENLCIKLNLERKKVIAFIGTLSLPTHPVNLLLEAFPKVLNAHPDSVLMLVGGGEDINRLQQLARKMGIIESVRFCGRVPHSEVPLYYGLSDVSVDPVYDNAAARGRSPIKLFESWASGVPFISSDVGDRRFLLGDPLAGLLARPGDPDSLGRLINNVLSDPNLAETLRKRGSERVKSYYMDQLVQKLEAIYQG